MSQLGTIPCWDERHEQIDAFQAEQNALNGFGRPPTSDFATEAALKVSNVAYYQTAPPPSALAPARYQSANERLSYADYSFVGLVLV